MNLLDDVAARGITPPTAKTLARYGLSAVDWVALLASQNWKCAVCLRDGRRWNTDHEHVPGWIRLPPEQRKIYVRGILCWHCNRHSVPSNMTSAEGARVASYLATYEERRDRLRKEI